MSPELNTLTRDTLDTTADLWSQVGVETKSDVFSFDCRHDETLLAAGLAAGFALPYGCATGTCGTCRARVMHGDADPGWIEAPGYRRLKRDKGDVLLCQARALGSCSLRVATSISQPTVPTRTLLRREGRVVRTRRLTRDVLEFEAALSRPMDFDAGQFVTLRHAGIMGQRAYSMVNYGKGTERLTFVVKRKPSGAFSDFLFDSDPMRAEFDIVGPLGRATFRPQEDRDFLCVAGGSGIAGMMAMLRHATTERYFTRRRGHVFFGVRTVSDAFYLEDFAEHLLAGRGGLEVTIAVSEESEVPSAHPDFPNIRLARGFVHEVLDHSIDGCWATAIGFVAGPQPMVDAAISVLLSKGGLSGQDIRFDKFS